MNTSFRMVALSAAVISAWTNALVYAVASGLGIFASLSFRPVRGGELTLGPVLIGSFLIPLMAFVVFDQFRRSQSQAYDMFRSATLLAATASLLIPVTIPAWSWQQIAVIDLMHIVVASCTLYHIRLVPEGTFDIATS